MCYRKKKSKSKELKEKVEETLKSESRPGLKTSQTETESAAIIKPGLTKAERTFLEMQEKRVRRLICFENFKPCIQNLILPFVILSE